MRGSRSTLRECALVHPVVPKGATVQVARRAENPALATPYMQRTCSPPRVQFVAQFRRVVAPEVDEGPHHAGVGVACFIPGPLLSPPCNVHEPIEKGLFMLIPRSGVDHFVN